MKHKFSDCTRVEMASDLPVAFAIAADIAELDDLVLLSPACASLDMYRNFQERGDHFQQLVRELMAEGG